MTKNTKLKKSKESLEDTLERQSLLKIREQVIQFGKGKVQMAQKERMNQKRMKLQRLIDGEIDLN